MDWNTTVPVEIVVPSGEMDVCGNGVDRNIVLTPGGDCFQTSRILHCTDTWCWLFHKLSEMLHQHLML